MITLRLHHKSRKKNYLRTIARAERKHVPKMIFLLGLQLTPHPSPVLYLLHALGDSTKSLRLSSLVPFAIRTYFVSSVRKSASLTEVNLTGRGNYDNVTFASLESKEKLFEDNSVSRAVACSENDFSFNS